LVAELPEGIHGEGARYWVLTWKEENEKGGERGKTTFVGANPNSAASKNT